MSLARWIIVSVWMSLFGVALAADRAGGEPVLIPDFTPVSVSEFITAFELQDVVYEELRHQGFTVLTSSTVRTIVGEGFTSCADVPDCPRGPLMNLPARLAVVVSVGRTQGELYGSVEIHHLASAEPVWWVDIPIDPDRLERFGIEVALGLLDVQADLPPMAPELVAAGEQLVASAPTVDDEELNLPDDPFEDEPDEEPEQVSEAAPHPDPDDRWSLDERYYRGSRKGYAKSPWSGDAWVRSTRTHSGRVIIEVRGGVVYGAVNRQAEVLAEPADDGTFEFTWYQEAPDVGTGGVVGAYVGFAPVTWLDVGLAAYLEIALNAARLGWMGEGAYPEYGARNTATSLSARFQPRIRGWIVPLGVVKPYLFAGFDLWYFPNYALDIEDDLDYPEPTGGWVPGADLGAGVQFDPGLGYGLFLEMSYIQRFGERAGTSTTGQGTGFQDTPFDEPTWTISALAGIQFRI